MAKQVLASKLRRYDQIIIEGVVVVVRHWPKLKQGFVQVQASAEEAPNDILRIEFLPDEKVLKL